MSQLSSELLSLCCFGFVSCAAPVPPVLGDPVGIAKVTLSVLRASEACGKLPVCTAQHGKVCSAWLNKQSGVRCCGLAYSSVLILSVPQLLMWGFPLAGFENQIIAHISGALDLSN